MTDNKRTILQRLDAAGRFIENAFLVGLLGAMGFTVALFIADAANGNAAIKLGAIASFVFLLLAIGIGRSRYMTMKFPRNS